MGRTRFYLGPISGPLGEIERLLPATLTKCTFCNATLLIFKYVSCSYISVAFLLFTGFIKPNFYSEEIFDETVVKDKYARIRILQVKAQLNYKRFYRDYISKYTVYTQFDVMHFNFRLLDNKPYYFSTKGNGIKKLVTIKPISSDVLN